MFGAHKNTRGIIAALVLLIGAAAGAAVTPNANLTADQQASRFLAQATFGPSPDAITELRLTNYDYSGWIDREATKPVSAAAPMLTSALSAGQITTIDKAANRRARNQVMLSAPDQLRQRVAFAPEPDHGDLGQ